MSWSWVHNVVDDLAVGVFVSTVWRAVCRVRSLYHSRGVIWRPFYRDWDWGAGSPRVLREQVVHMLLAGLVRQGRFIHDGAGHTNTTLHCVSVLWLLVARVVGVLRPATVHYAANWCSRCLLCVDTVPILQGLGLCWGGGGGGGHTGGHTTGCSALNHWTNHGNSRRNG